MRNTTNTQRARHAKRGQDSFPGTQKTVRTPFFGFTLLEVILAVVIAATVAAMGVHFMRPTGVHSRQKACDAMRQTVQLEAGRYRDANGVWPRSDLRELTDPAYFVNGVPSCPAQGGHYSQKGSQVVCPVHEATRQP